LKKILFADDEEALRILYREEFQAPGIEVLLARNGQEALDVCQREWPDLVVLDIRMPVLDGLEALRRIKEMRQGLPVIICTAWEETGPQSDVDWDEYVVKSADMRLLRAAIKRRLLEPEGEGNQ
jgi:DNA-binding response OmpR family regulator